MKLSEIDLFALSGAQLITIVEFYSNGVVISASHGGSKGFDEIEFETESMSKAKWKALKKKLESLSNFKPLELVGVGESEPLPKTV